MGAESAVPKMGGDADLKTLAADLSSDDWYTRKHALWTLARHVQAGGGIDFADDDLLKIIVGGIADPDETIRARSIWLAGLLAGKGLGGAIAEIGGAGQLKNMLDDDTAVSYCPDSSGQLERTTVGGLAAEALKILTE